MTETYASLRSRLLKNPEQFEARGEGNALLKEHFRGAPVNLLRPLLRHSNASVRGTAMFVANELGAAATELIDDIIPLMKDLDIHTQYDAIESVWLCSVGQQVDKFSYVLRELENTDAVICSSTMRLVSKARPSQIEAGIKHDENLGPNRLQHEKGLRALANWRNVSRVEILGMLDDPTDLTQKYGAMVAGRRFDQSPHLIQQAAKSENEAVSRFARQRMQ